MDFLDTLADLLLTLPPADDDWVELVHTLGDEVILTERVLFSDLLFSAAA